MQLTLLTKRLAFLVEESVQHQLIGYRGFISMVMVLKFEMYSVQISVYICARLRKALKNGTLKCMEGGWILK